MVKQCFLFFLLLLFCLHCTSRALDNYNLFMYIYMHEDMHKQKDQVALMFGFFFIFFIWRFVSMRKSLDTP